MTDERIRERAKLQFRCTNCAGSGRVMMGALTSAICQSCDGFGARRAKLDEIVAFAAAECDAEREQPRELPSHDEIVKMLGDGWKGFKLNDRDDLDFVIGQIRLAIMKCDAIRSRVAASGEEVDESRKSS